MGKSGEAEQTLIIDASALLAIYLREPNAGSVADLLDSNSVRLMSTMTAAEVLIKLFALRLASREDFWRDMYTYGIKLVDVTFRQAVIAAEARNKYPLNLGDCFVYALAIISDGTVVTFDDDFKKCGIPILVPG